MESAKQERKNLMNDMPIVNRASGSWMSKHSRAAGSPAEMGGSGKMNPIEMGGSGKMNPIEMGGSGKMNPIEMGGKINPIEMGGKMNPIEMRGKMNPIEMRGKMNPIEMRGKKSPMAIDTDPKSGKRDKRFTYDSQGRPDGFLGKDGSRTIPDNVNLKAAQEGTGAFDPKSGGNVPFKGSIVTSGGGKMTESQFRDPSNKNMAMGVVDHSGKFNRFNSPKSNTDNSLSKSQVFKDYSNQRDEYNQRRKSTSDLVQKYKDYNKAGGQFKQLNKKDPKSGR